MLSCTKGISKKGEKKTFKTTCIALELTVKHPMSAKFQRYIGIAFEQKLNKLKRQKNSLPSKKAGLCLWIAQTQYGTTFLLAFLLQFSSMYLSADYPKIV